MSLKEQFDDFHKRLLSVTDFKNTDDRLKYEKLLAQINVLCEVLENPSEEQLDKVKKWLDDNKEQIEYFLSSSNF